MRRPTSWTLTLAVLLVALLLNGGRPSSKPVPRPAVAPAPPRPGARLPLYGRTRSEASSRRVASDKSVLCQPWPL